MGEKYQVLARRYRPQQFSDVVGQEAILQTLKNALRRGFLAHAYLFSGSRGVGKTTLARLFAKALNCAAPSPECEPCNQCPSCQDISMGQSLDVMEIDGASNRGIDDIRQINETVGFAPSHGKYKIYIIDEVHMLTKEAFNALLKTLEEPPEKAKFFFATTEPHKVLPTIISRCQRFDLGRLTPVQISKKLASISLDLGREVDTAALDLLSNYADGALRDAESLLDQILCFSSEKITEADVRNALGLVPQDLFFELDRAFSRFEIGYAFKLVDQLYQSGKDLGHFLEQLIEHYRNITACKTFRPPELVARYAESAGYYTQPQTLSILDLLLKAEAQMSRAISPRIALEMTLLQVLRTKNRIPVEALVRRLSELETSLKEGTPLISQPEALDTPEDPKEIVAAPKAEVTLPEGTSLASEPISHPEAPQVYEAPKEMIAEPKIEVTLPEDLSSPETVTEELPPIPLLEIVSASEESTNPPEILVTELPVLTEEPIQEAPIQATRQVFDMTIPDAPKDLPPIRPMEADQITMNSFDPSQLPSPFPPIASEEAPKIVAKEPEKQVPKLEKIVEKPADKTAGKHPSIYHTLMRFTAVELEGTFKN